MLRVQTTFSILFAALLFARRCFHRALQLEEERRRVELARMEAERAALAAKLAEEQEKSIAEIKALKAAREQLAAEAEAKVKVRV